MVPDAGGSRISVIERELIMVDAVSQFTAGSPAGTDMLALAA